MNSSKPAVMESTQVKNLTSWCKKKNRKMYSSNNIRIFWKQFCSYKDRKIERMLSPKNI